MAEEKRKDNGGELRGATRFPDGRIRSDVEGEIRFAVGRKDGRVFIDFGQSVTWIGMRPDQANDLADLLRIHAHGARR